MSGTKNDHQTRLQQDELIDPEDRHEPQFAELGSKTRLLLGQIIGDYCSSQKSEAVRTALESRSLITTFRIHDVREVGKNRVGWRTANFNNRARTIQPRARNRVNFNNNYDVLITWLLIMSLRLLERDTLTSDSTS